MDETLEHLQQEKGLSMQSLAGVRRPEPQQVGRARPASLPCIRRSAAEAQARHTASCRELSDGRQSGLFWAIVAPGAAAKVAGWHCWRDANGNSTGRKRPQLFCVVTAIWF